MKFAALFATSAALAIPLADAAQPSEILVPGTKLYTESITSTSDGSIIVGAMGPGAIYRAPAGASVAEVWIKPGTAGLLSVAGVFADERSNTLWACANPFESNPFAGPRTAAELPPAALHAFDLSTGAPKGKWQLPTANSICNDIAVGNDGTAYATDMKNMEILRLRPSADALEIWAGHGMFGATGGLLDGISVVSNTVLVNTLVTSKLFSVPIRSDGAAGPAIEVRLDRPLDTPDGQRSAGDHEILLVDAHEGGRLVRIELAGANLDSGTVTTIKSGFPDGPASVTVVGKTAYVVEAHFATADKIPAAPFKAKAVPLVP